MNRIDRLFGILTLLQSKKYVAAETIAEKFGISVRTVYRDIKAMNEQGIPVSFEQHKGYFIVQGYFLPPVSFTTEEANAMLLLEHVVSGFTDRSIQEHYNNVLVKIKAVLRSGQKEKVEVLSHNIKTQLPARLKSEYKYLSTLQTSITSKTILEISYTNHKEEISTRKLEPIGLIFYAFSWHLIGWCHLRKDYRDFKVSRINGLRDTGMPFERQEHMEINEYMKQLPVDF